MAAARLRSVEIEDKDGGLGLNRRRQRGFTSDREEDGKGGGCCWFQIGASTQGREGERGRGEEGRERKEERGRATQVEELAHRPGWWWLCRIERGGSVG